MFWLLLFVFVVMPIVEIYVIIQVAQVIGGWETLALLIVESFIGAWLMKRQGAAVLDRIQRQLEEYRLPGKDLVDGGLILFAGALMLTPGFVTDILGFVLLVPPTRAVVRRIVMASFLTKRLGRGYAIFRGGTRIVGARFANGRTDVFEASATEAGGSPRHPYDVDTTATPAPPRQLPS